MRLLVATRSSGKQREFRELLQPLGFDIVFPEDVGLPESPAEAGLECFETFEDNAAAKAWWFAAASGLVAVADDSGLEVDALHGAPGVHSKRYAGADGPDDVVSQGNNAALLAALSAAAPVSRSARYRCVLVLARPPLAAAWPFPVPAPGRAVVVQGLTEGLILEEGRGRGGFGYDPLFLSSELGVSFAEASPADKHRVSHRGRAVTALLELLRASMEG